MSAHLMLLLDNNISRSFQRSGSRSEYESVKYVAKNRLKYFMDEVLPVWNNPSTEEDVKNEEDVEKLLIRFRYANVVHEIIQAYGIGVKDSYVEDDFANSPAVMDVLGTLWHTELVVDNLEPLKRIKMVSDLILRRCPSFHKLYKKKKSEYDSIVSGIDKRNLRSWSDTHTCTCGQDSHSSHD